MSGSHSRNKGKRGEREICDLAREHELTAERCWETAQSPNAFERACDCIIGGDRAQVKRFGEGFKMISIARWNNPQGKAYQALQNGVVKAQGQFQPATAPVAASLVAPSPLAEAVQPRGTLSKIKS